MNRAGRGILELSRVAGHTAVTRAQANSPLRLLNPRGANGSAWVFTSTFGGGLVAGDDVDLDILARAGTTTLLSTQASTKVYRACDGRTARQAMRATIEPGAVLAILPDPVSCFAGAHYEQRQRFDLDPSGTLVLVDWLNAGRAARGERWGFARYASRNDVHVGGRHVLADALVLDPADGPIDAPHRMGPYECLALLLLVGPAVADAAARVLETVAAEPVHRGTDLVVSASPLAGGVLLRAAGRTTELVARYLRDRLDFITPVLGDDPFRRKW